jgi:hypothetical protein
MPPPVANTPAEAAARCLPIKLKEKAIISSKLGRFFEEIGRPISRSITLSPPSPAELQRVVQAGQRYGYWFATPEENASAGVSSF